MNNDIDNEHGSNIAVHPPSPNAQWSDLAIRSQSSNAKHSVTTSQVADKYHVQHIKIMDIFKVLVLVSVTGFSMILIILPFFVSGQTPELNMAFFTTGSSFLGAILATLFGTYKPTRKLPMTTRTVTDEYPLTPPDEQV